MVIMRNVMDLETLNLAEESLLLRVGKVTGLIEEIDSQLERNGVYAEYRKIFEDYVELIDSDFEGLEALKRSIFLLWYEQAEPSCFSGLSKLGDTRANLKLYAALEDGAETTAFDLELRWMLPYYDSIAEWVFEDGLPNLRRFLDGSNRELWLREIKAANFIGRGQMGNYWTSVLKSNAICNV